MQRSEMRTMVYRLMRIDDTVDVPNSDVNRYLDDGYNEVVAYTDWPWCYVATPDDVNMIADTNTYALEAAVRRVVAVINTAQNHALKEISMAEWLKRQNAVTSSSRPYLYAYSEQVLYVYPTPANTDAHEVYYFQHPSFGATDASTPDFDAAYHTVLVDWAMHRMWEQEEDFERSDEYRARFESRLKRMQDFYQTTGKDVPLIYGEYPNISHPGNMPFLSDAASGGAT